MSAKRNAKGRFVKSQGGTVKPKRRRRARRNPDDAPAVALAGATSNPPAMQDLVEFILPGFAGYGATKMLARIVAVQLAKKYPSAGKHVAAGSTVIAFLAAWFLLHRIKKLEQYHTPVVVGSAIASLQTIVQTYLPKYGWMVSDAPQLNPAASKGAAGVPLMAATAPETLYPGGPEIVDDDEDVGELDPNNMGSLGDAADGLGDSVF
jgi:hypothetical protein